MSGSPGRVRRILEASALVTLLRAASRKAETDEEPQIVVSSARVERLADLATELAGTTPDDYECVRVLTASAGRHRRDLWRAAAFGRLGGGARESGLIDRANRLLMAAATGGEVEQPSPESERLFGRVDQLYSVSVEEAFPILTSLSPRLVALQEHWSARSVDDPDHSDELWGELLASLAPVVGPDASEEVNDPLLRTAAAHNIARLFLALQIGLLNHVDYD